MNKKQMLFKVLSILCVLGLLTACAPAATQAPAATEAPAATQASAATEPPAATEAPANAEPVTLSYLADDSENTQATVHALADVVPRGFLQVVSPTQIAPLHAGPTFPSGLQRADQ